MSNAFLLCEASCCCGLGLCLLFLVCGFSDAWHHLFNLLPPRSTHALWWSNSSAWTVAQCKVLNAGVAYRGGCERADLQQPGQQSVAPLDPREWRECPGISWCADEGGNCSCSGMVSFAAAKYATTEADPIHHTSSLASGSVRCALTDAGGPFDHDPALGQPKSCFCMPNDVLESIAGRPVQKQICSTLANNEYQMVDGEASSLLELQGVDESGNVCYLLYLPWALVEIDGVLRCAYEFGVPDASVEDSFTAQFVGEWMRHRGNAQQCWLRTTPNDCAVALRAPWDLVKEEDDRERWYQIVFVGCLLGFLLCWLPACALWERCFRVQARDLGTASMCRLLEDS